MIREIISPVVIPVLRDITKYEGSEPSTKRGQPLVLTEPKEVLDNHSFQRF